MFLRWWKDRRRRRLAALPFPEPWLHVLQHNVRLYSRLTAHEQRTVRQYVQVFVREKNWEGCGGLQMSDEIRVTVAGLVAILVLGLGDQYFDHVLSILVYPGAYLADDDVDQLGEWTLHGTSAREGEAWYRGPVILSWSDVRAESRHSHCRHNLVFHEFAHQLDMLNGRLSDGVPIMQTRAQYERWEQVMGEHFERLVRDCERHRSTFLDCYGAESRSEFFAVATEAFFQQPEELRARYAELYQVLREFYGQDPASRVAGT